MGFVKLGLVLFMATTSMYGWQRELNQRGVEKAPYLVQLENSSQATQFERVCTSYDLSILEHDPARNLYLVRASEAAAAKLQAAQPARLERATQVLVEVEKQSDITSDVEALGGLAKRRLDNVPFQAVAVPIRQLRALFSVPGIKSIRKDREKTYGPGKH